MFIKFSQFFYVIFILYYGWFQIAFFKIPNMLLILGVLIIGFIILDSLVTGKNLISAVTLEMFLWSLFAITSVIFGLFLVTSKGHLVSSISTFIQFLILIYGIVYISNKKRNIDFFINVFIILSIISALTTLIAGVEVGQGRITMGLNNNPNSLGITMVIGLCCVLYKHSFNRYLYSIISFSSILLFLYITLLTGSRKSLVAIVLIISYWLLVVVLKEIKLLNFFRNLKGTLTILLISIISVSILPFFGDMVIFERLNNLFESGDETRESMYSVAFEFFLNNPLVGIGYDNYRFLSVFGTYSHSTYAEALACTGIIGSFLYFIPYILLVGRYIILAFISKLDFIVRKEARVMLGLLGILLFLGFGVIHFYEMTSTIAFGMIIAFYDLNKRGVNSNN